MGVFNKLFGSKKKDTENSIKSDFHIVKVLQISKLTKESVKVTFDISNDAAPDFKFIPGQYIDVKLKLDGKEEIRSYSICSGLNEPLSIGIKKVEGGKVSTYINNCLKIGDDLSISIPRGNFKLNDPNKNYVAFAAGSGITPILSIAKEIAQSENGGLDLFYANKTADAIMFLEELHQLQSDKVRIHYSLSQEEKEGFIKGRFSQENIQKVIKNDLSLLKKEGYFICGPEEMIVNAEKVLKEFGVSGDKIHFELFTTPVLMKGNVTIDAILTEFSGISQVKVILDDEEFDFELATDGGTILNEAEAFGVDAPYSCRGGVCCTCKAKVIEGIVKMDANLALTDGEIKDGYVLSCQAHPASEKVVISYDE